MVVDLLKVAMMNDETPIFRVTGCAGVPVSLLDCATQCTIPTQSIRPDRAAPAPVVVSFPVPRRVQDLVQSPVFAADLQPDNVELSRAAPGATFVTFHADELRPALGADLVSPRSAPVFEHWVLSPRQSPRYRSNFANPVGVGLSPCSVTGLRAENLAPDSRRLFQESAGALHASYRNLHPSIFSGNTMQSKGIDVL